MNTRTSVSDKERDQRCSRRDFLAGVGSAAGALAFAPATSVGGAAPAMSGEQEETAGKSSPARVGERLPSEVREFNDPVTGRKTRQLTAGAGHEYHLYYQTYCMTRDGRWLVFYSERDGRTDLYRLDRRDGTITRLTAGRSHKTGWWPWTPMAFQGVYAYISCINLVTDDVYYHDLDEIRAVNLNTLDDRLLAKGPKGMRPFSQLACSFDGAFVATVWVDQELADRVDASHEEAKAQGKPIQQAEMYWRDVMKSRLDVIDTRSGEVTTLVDLQAPFHNMAVAADNRHIIVITPPDGLGGLLVADQTRPGSWRKLTPPPGVGTFCHFHAGQNGRISFDSFIRDPKNRELETFIGWINVDGAHGEAWSLGRVGYCHVGHDLAGRFLFAAVDNGNGACGHHLAVVRPGLHRQAELEPVTADLPSGNDQRWHAHPVLTPDRRAIVYTAMGDDGFCHLFEVDVRDLTDAPTDVRKRRDLHLFFTMDCERVLDRDMSKHGIWGPPDWAFSERSIRRFDAILADEKLMATYFIVPDVARAHAKMWAELAARGNELGIHLHPQGFGDMKWKQFMPEYTQADQLKLLDEAMTAWQVAIGYRPLVFRPGNFSGSPTVFSTLLRAGLVAGSVSLPGRVRTAYHANWAEFSPEAQFLPASGDRADAFLELPVTVRRDSAEDGGQHRDPAHLRVEAHSIGPEQFGEIIRKHLSAPPADASMPRILVVMTHNTPDYTEASMETRLRDLIQTIRTAAVERDLRLVNTSMLTLRERLLS